MSVLDTELLEAAKNGDKYAAEQILIENSALIWSIVRRFFGRGVDCDDLYQLGCMGFIKAIQGFDSSYGTQFSTYAVPKITGEIRRFLRDDGTVKVSRSIKERAQTVKNAKVSLEQKLGRDPYLSEIAELTGFTPEDIAVAETATSTADSLQREMGEDGLTLEGVLGDFLQEEKMLEQLSLKEAVDSLPEREKLVIKLRYYRGMTQDSAAKVLKVSQVQVSRIEKRAIDLLRKQLS
jgi:RNA polymerase sporulation-specific sigma factor